MSLKKIIEENKKKKQKAVRKKAARNIALGAVTGTIVGGAIGVLLAPKSGKETRGALADGVKDLTGKAKVKFEDAKEKLDEASEKIMDKIKRSEDKVEEKVECILGKEVVAEEDEGVND